MSRKANPQEIFAAAERAFMDRRLHDARALLTQIEQITHPAVHHLRALVESHLGNLEASRKQFEAAAGLVPGDPAIWNNYGNLLDQFDENDAALRSYDRALSLSPAFLDAAFNRANLLRKLSRPAEAREAYWELLKKAPGDVRYWNGLAALEKQDGDLQAAAAAYDRALAIAPNDQLATIGRARVALERQEPDVLARYRRARSLFPRELELALDEIETRLNHGEPTAIEELAELVESSPNWIHGQIELGRIRWERGAKADFSDHLEKLLRQDPGNAALWRAYVQLVADCGLAEKAADIAQRGSEALGNDPFLKLLEAIYAGAAGQIDRAEPIFLALPSAMAGRPVHETVHWIRRGDLDRALLSIELALARNKWDFAAWGVAELLYRKTEHPRAEWLSGQPGLISTFQIPLHSADFKAVDELLADLHRQVVESIGHSVRGGTQTRWSLFDRIEPELARLHGAIKLVLEEHLAGLPPEDPTHPLLRSRNCTVKIGPSWSVRFVDRGHHVPHYHPKGLISSACYFRVPPAASKSPDGWLEIGRPPPDFLMDLDPIQLVEPAPGRLVLFPSYLLHGTTAFRQGERMSVAFDVVPAGNCP